MELRADSFKCDVTRLIRGLWLYFQNQIPKNNHLDDSYIFFIRTDDFTWVPRIPGQFNVQCTHIDNKNTTTFTLGPHVGSG